jgi:hypothetical protein
VWQVVYDELEDRGLEIVAVALDTAGRPAAGRGRSGGPSPRRPDVIRRLRGWPEDAWSRKAAPTFTCLIDEEHVVAELYGMTNVPMAVWIDEEGRIVRPTEPPGASDHFRRMDPGTYAIPDEDAAALEHNRRRYVDALRDWVEKGAASEHVLDAAEVRRRMRRPDERDVRAGAHVRVARLLYQRGDAEAAKRHLRTAVELRPDRWDLRRQAMVLEPELVGALNVSDEYYAAMEALGDRPFYPQIDMPGMTGPPAWLERSGR